MAMLAPVGMALCPSLESIQRKLGPLPTSKWPESVFGPRNDDTELLNLPHTIGPFHLEVSDRFRVYVTVDEMASVGTIVRNSAKSDCSRSVGVPNRWFALVDGSVRYPT